MATKVTANGVTLTIAVDDISETQSYVLVKDYSMSSSAGSTYKTKAMALYIGSSTIVSFSGVSDDASTRKLSCHKYLNQVASVVGKTITKSTAAQTVTVKMTVFGVQASANVTVPALPSYKVTYGANGGTGSPAAQTKYYGKTLVLSTARPTRAGYSFHHWTAGGSTTIFPGDSYTENRDCQLRAIWKPTVTAKLSARRDSSDPTKAVISGSWSCPEYCLLSYSVSPSSGVTKSELSAPSGKSGTTTATLEGLDPDGKYAVTLTAKTNMTSDLVSSTYSFTAVIMPDYSVLDFAPGGEAIGMLAKAPDAGLRVGGGRVELGADGENRAQVAFQGANWTNTFLRLRGGADAYGDAVSLGAGGLSVLGGGESCLAVLDEVAEAGWSYGTEWAVVAADTDILLMPGMQSRTTSPRYRVLVTTAGNIRLDQTTDAGKTWTTVTYFQKESRVQPKANGGTGISNFLNVQNANGLSTTVADGKWVKLATTPSLAAGSWLVIVGGYAAAGSTGRRHWTLKASSVAQADVSATRLDSFSVSANGGGTRYATFPVFVQPSSATTYCVWGWQNNGANLSMSAYARAIRLG